MSDDNDGKDPVDVSSHLKDSIQSLDEAHDPVSHPPDDQARDHEEPIGQTSPVLDTLQENQVQLVEGVGPGKEKESDASDQKLNSSLRHSPSPNERTDKFDTETELAMSANKLAASNDDATIGVPKDKETFHASAANESGEKIAFANPTSTDSKILAHSPTAEPGRPKRKYCDDENQQLANDSTGQTESSTVPPNVAAVVTPSKDVTSGIIESTESDSESPPAKRACRRNEIDDLGEISVQKKTAPHDNAAIVTELPGSKDSKPAGGEPDLSANGEAFATGATLSKASDPRATVAGECEIDHKSVVIIMPPTTQGRRKTRSSVEKERKKQSEKLHLVRELGNKVLSTRHAQARLKEVFEDGKYSDSIRCVPTEDQFDGILDSTEANSTDRFELVVDDDPEKSSNCFDEIILGDYRNPTATKTSILDYAKSQAMEDERLQGQEWEFENFRLVVSYGTVEAEAPRIDMGQPSYQFCMLLTSGSGIIGFPSQHRIQCAKDLGEAWERADSMDQSFGLDPIPMPAALVQAMEQTSAVNRLLKDFGNVMIPDEELDQVATKAAHSSGTVFSWPVGAMYAEPRSDKFQAMLFFSAFPQNKSNTVPGSMSSKTQYTSVLLCDKLIRYMWRQPGVGLTERKYLIHKLLRYIRQGGNTPKDARVSRCWSSEISDEGRLTAFIRLMERNNTTREMDLKWVEHTAQDVWAVPKLRRAGRAGQTKHSSSWSSSSG